MAGQGLYSPGGYLSSSRERSKLDTFVRAALQSFERDDYDAQRFTLYKQSDTDNQDPFTLQDFCKLFYRVRQFTQDQMQKNSKYLQVELPTPINEEHIQHGCEGGQQCVWVEDAPYPAQSEARLIGAIAMIHLKNGPSLWYYRHNNGKEHAEKLVIDVIREWLQQRANLENLKKIVLYITYQPCHEFTTKSKPPLVLNCTNTVIDFYEACLRSHKIKFVIKIPFLHKAHWNPEDFRKTTEYDAATRETIRKQKEGLVKLLDHDSIQLQAMDQLDWKLLHGLALQDGPKVATKGLQELKLKN